MLIEVENLSVTFTAQGREVRAVQNVSLAVNAQESYGLVGESGSGKSTILRAICGLAPVSGGKIRINGEKIRHDKAFSKRVQMVFKTPTPVCIRATASTAPCQNRWRSTACR